MPILTIKEGVRYAIYAWRGEDSCQLLQFLENLDRESNPDATRIAYLISRTADHGPPRNELHCRALEGKHAEGLFEFKAPGGTRVLWFYDKNRIIICTHGFVKKGQKTPRKEIDKAQAIRQLYLEETENAR
jgi:phage-related protein